MRTTDLSYAIIYGVAEGPFQSKKLRLALQKAGYRQTDSREADIIIAHSGGCLTVPKQARAKLFLHINPPYWPGKPLTKSVREKLTYDFRLRRQRHQLQRWVISLAANGLYGLNLRRTISMILPYFRAKQAFAKLPKSRHVFIRTHIDSYCDPASLLKATRGKHSYLTMAGHHDDCWREPAPYVQAIQALYN
jgi:hypothetical protein